jgi:UDP-N-acetyl-D-galactosamine dehydrogenase
VLEAAGTKWNFLKFFPGLVGGHCIGVDPYYLLHKSKELGYHAQMINAGRFINDSMGGYVAKQLVKQLVKAGKHIQESRILIKGFTFKEDVSDIRNTKVIDVYRELLSYGVQVDVVDPYADAYEVKEEYQFELCEKAEGKYDALILAVSHEEYMNQPKAYFAQFMKEDGIFVDIKGLYRAFKNEFNYWSL